MATTISQPEFRYETGVQAPGRTLPQRIGTKLWAPMLVMALASLAVGVVLAIARATTIAGGGSATTIAALGHLVPGAMFLGFAAVFAAISFAIARILGEFREGGGRAQAASGRRIETLKMSPTARGFMLLMALAMMLLLATVVLHVVAAAAIAGGSEDALAAAERWAIWLEGFRRLGVALYLLAITLGLASIIHVLRFQSARIRQLPDEPRIRP